MDIRFAADKDLASILDVCKTAFSNEENQLIMELSDSLIREKTNPPIKFLVAETDNKIIGYAVYSPVFCASNQTVNGYILAPLAVLPEHQRKGVGCKLIKKGKEILSDNGVDILLVYGDPRYYEKFGFTREVAKKFTPPYQLEYEFGWLGMLLNKVENTGIKIKCVSSLMKPALW